MTAPWRHTLTIKLNKGVSGDTRYHECYVTPEILYDAGSEIFYVEAEKGLRDLFRGAYGDFETNRMYEVERKQVWEKVKNINTDDELEEIKEILGL